MNTQSDGKLKTILDKAAEFSQNIDVMHEKIEQLKENRTELIEQETKAEKELLRLAESMHEFQKEIISKITDLVAQVQREKEMETSDISADKNSESTVSASEKTEKSPPQSPPERSESKSEKRSESETEEVYLFDL